MKSFLLASHNQSLHDHQDHYSKLSENLRHRLEALDYSGMKETSVVFCSTTDEQRIFGGETDDHDLEQADSGVCCEFRHFQHVVDKSFFLCTAKFEWEGFRPVLWW